jgi:hypothetical protein
MQSLGTYGETQKHALLKTYPYRCTLSTLPADGTLALERPPRVELILAMGQTLVAGVVLGEPGCA